MRSVGLGNVIIRGSAINREERITLLCLSFGHCSMYILKHLENIVMYNNTQGRPLWFEVETKANIGTRSSDLCNLNMNKSHLISRRVISRAERKFPGYSSSDERNERTSMKCSGRCRDHVTTPSTRSELSRSTFSSSFHHQTVTLTHPATSLPSLLSEPHCHEHPIGRRTSQRLVEAASFDRFLLAQ